MTEQGQQDGEPFEQRHRDGSLWARGRMLDETMHGYWEWFRLDGTMMRSGAFDRGRRIGAWTTYDLSGAEHEVTDFGA